ncbi:MAG: hypothetical protein H0X35_16195 [Pseudonocardiales bacterium]|nr:hypothetical protein [Pseudonocardiales bacterium]
MRDKVGSLIVAVYSDDEVAASDFGALHGHVTDGPFEIIDAALVRRDDQGHVEVQKRPSRRSRRIANGRRGGMGVHFRRGLDRRDVFELGKALQLSSVAVVCVGRGLGVEQLIPELNSTDVVVNQITSTDLAFRALLGSTVG